jgi:osmotically-inducible protein OsmY
MSRDQHSAAVLTSPNPFAALFREIAETARTALRRSPYFELHDLSCDYSGGILTLRGTVPTYYLKQIAQTSVANVPGVVEVHNRVEVASPSAPAGLNAGWADRELLATY